MFQTRFLLALAILVVALPAWAAPTAAQREEMAAIGTLLTRAGNFQKNSKFKEATELTKEAQTRFEKLADGADEAMVGQLGGLHKRLTALHAFLELEGVELPELKPLVAAAKGTVPPGGGVSFVKQVLPVLNTRCGNCHIRNTRGMFSMATYETLMRGPMGSGKVIFPGDVKGSVLIEKVEGREMPPSGAGIPAEELDTLKKWVEQGAKFDGPDPRAQVSTLITGQPMPPATTLKVEPATGKETISFAKDIAPVLAANCTGCHGTQNPRNNFSMATFENLLRGGDRGEPLLPGKPADSLIVKKLKGTADGARMPQNQPPLADDVIAKFEKWIEEGAKFDGAGPRLPMADIAAIAKTFGQTHEELAADRAKLAEANWRLGMPGIEAQRVETEHFYVVGGVPEVLLADVAKKAEAQAPKVATMLKATSDQPLVKGKMALFVFGERYDYGEFGKMVERRDLPPSWRGHSRYTIVDAYGTVLLTKDMDYSVETLVAQELAAMHVASQGRGVPAWFSEGVGRVIASRVATGGDSRVARWDESVPAVIGRMTAADDFLTGKLPPEETDVAAYSFAKFLMAEPRKFQVLLDGLRKGGDFAQLFPQAYGGTPAQAAAVWIRKPPKPSPKRPAGK
jgi:cytochrome c553